MMQLYTWHEKIIGLLLESNESFLTKINGVDFNEAWNSRAMMKMGDVALPVISRNHLILSKISTNCTQDKLDVEELQKLSGNSPS